MQYQPKILRPDGFFTLSDSCEGHAAFFRIQTQRKPANFRKNVVNCEAKFNQNLNYQPEGIPL